MDEGLAVAPGLEEQLGEVVPGRGQVGHGVDRGLVGGHRLVESRGIEGVVAALDVVALGRREPLRAFEGTRRELPGLRHVPEVGVHHRQLREGHGESGIGRDRLLQDGPGLVLLEPLVVVHPLDEVAVGFDGGRGHVLELLIDALGHGPELETAADPAGQLVHEGEETLLGVTLHPLRREDLAALGVLKLGLDADLGSGPDEAAHEGGGDVRPAGHLAHDLGRDGGVVALPQLVEKLVEPRGAQDPQGRRLREVGDQHVGEPGPQPVELGVAGEVVEVEDGERRAVVPRRGRGAVSHRNERQQREDECPGHRRGHQPAPSLGHHGEAAASARGLPEQLSRVDVALEVLEVAAQVGRGLVAVLRPLLEGALDHARERAGTSARSSWTGRGVSLRIEERTERLVPPVNGRSPVAIS